MSWAPSERTVGQPGSGPLKKPDYPMAFFWLDFPRRLRRWAGFGVVFFAGVDVGCAAGILMAWAGDRPAEYATDHVPL